MDSVIWAGLIVAGALVYLGIALGRRPSPQIVYQPSAPAKEDPSQSLAPIVVSENRFPESGSELAYSITLNLGSKHVGILCVPNRYTEGGSHFHEQWSYYKYNEKTERFELIDFGDLQRYGRDMIKKAS